MDARELDLYESVCVTARTLSEKFTEPDDDWAPVAFAESEEGDGGVFPMDQFMQSEQTKDVLANVALPFLIEHAKASRLVMILSVWSAQVASREELEPMRYVPPSQRENREEKVLIVEFTADGVQRQAWAPIIRHEDRPPELGDWEEMEGDSFGGRFVDPVVTALKRVRGL